MKTIGSFKVQTFRARVCTECSQEKVWPAFPSFGGAVCWECYWREREGRLLTALRQIAGRQCARGGDAVSSECGECAVCIARSALNSEAL